jgi:hypothetical protein
MKNELKNMFTEHWKYLAINAACKLNLFDTLEIPKSAKELSQELKANERTLIHLLNALCSLGYLKQTYSQYALTVKSELLTENHPDCLKYACMNWAGEHLTAWQNIDYSVLTGKSAFENLYQNNFFDYLSRHSERLNAYHKAMYEYARDDYRTLPEKINFGKHKSVIDCGGGYGVAISAVKTKFIQVDCYLFDLPQVIENAMVTNIQKIGGSFFETIPQVADAIILSRVLHDWNNEKASLILQNCFEALPKGGTLYVIENCSDKITTDLSLLSLNMVVMCESYERNSAEYINLVQQTGFDFQEEVQLNDLQTILIFKKLKHKNLYRKI